MRKIAEIRQDLSAKIAEAKGIDRSNVEAMDACSEAIRTLTSELNLANEAEAAEQRAAEQKINSIEGKEGRKFSFTKFVRELSSTGKLTGIEAEIAEMGAEEYRRLGLSQSGQVIPSACLRAATGQNAGTNADGGYLKEEMAAKYVDVLKKNLAVAQMGATILTDLVGSLPVITTAQVAASWDAEGDAASAVKAAFGKVSMTPHRNYVQMAVTKDLLRQTSADVEALLLDLMSQAHANLIDNAAINGTGSSDQPTGILSAANTLSYAMGTNGDDLDWAAVVALEGLINTNDANRGKLGYLTNAKVIAQAKCTAKDSGSGRFIMEEGPQRMLNGYPCGMDSYVPSNLTKGTSSGNCSALIFGNFADLYIGQWGGLDLVVDPYTGAGRGEVILTINAWNDVLVAQPKSFAIIKDILA